MVDAPRDDSLETRDTKENKMKCRVSIRMVNETFCKTYEDVTISLKTKLHYECSLKEMTRVVDGNDVKDATNHFFTY